MQGLATVGKAMDNTKLKVALTRQSSDNLPLARALEVLGYSILDWPAIEIKPCQPHQDNWRSALLSSDAIGLVSPNAARAFISFVRPETSNLPPLLSQGPGTTRVLVEAGFTVASEALPATTKGMANALISLSQSCLLYTSPSPRD